MRLSKFSLFFSLYIIVSSSFMQQVWSVWKLIFGVKLLILFFICGCILAVSGILYKNIKSGFNLKKISFICVICISGFIFAWRQPYLPEKAHVLEFGLLGWSVMRDLGKQDNYALKNIWKAIIFISIVGYLEEGFQKLLPWRVFEIRDIATDVLSGMLGIILNLLSQTGLRSFIRPF